MRSSKQDVTVTTSDEKQNSSRSVKVLVAFGYKDKVCLILEYATVSNEVFDLNILSFDLINFNKIGT